jgi:hypothetical protein
MGKSFKNLFAIAVHLLLNPAQTETCNTLQDLTNWTWKLHISNTSFGKGVHD